MDNGKQGSDRVYSGFLGVCKMRVLIISQYFPPDMGGGATRAFNVAKGLFLAGCDVTVVTAFPHYPTGNIPKKYRGKILHVEYDKKIKVIRTFVPPLASKGVVNRFLLFVSFMISSLFALPLVGRVDIVWAANPNVISAFPSMLYGIIKRCPVIQNVDDLWPESLYDLGMAKSPVLSKLAEFMARVAYKVVRAITPISPGYVGVIVHKYGIDPRKICVIPAGVDLKRFSFLKEKGSVKKQRDRFIVLYIGAFSPAYDFDQVFKAAKLLEPYSDIHIVIQGGGELAPTLKSRVREMGLKNVSVIEKIVSREEVAKILNDVDVLLLPLSGLGSIEMGISSKLYEYQAAGKPIICCSSGQPGRYVAETGSGIVVDPGDYEALAKAILYLRNNPDVVEEMGKSGRQYVENNLSIEKIGLKMKKLFKYITVRPSRK